MPQRDWIIGNSSGTIIRHQKGLRPPLGADVADDVPSPLWRRERGSRRRFFENIAAALVRRGEDTFAPFLSSGASRAGAACGDGAQKSKGAALARKARATFTGRRIGERPTPPALPSRRQLHIAGSEFVVLARQEQARRSRKAHTAPALLPSSRRVEYKRPLGNGGSLPPPECAHLKPRSIFGGSGGHRAHSLDLGLIEIICPPLHHRSAVCEIER